MLFLLIQAGFPITHLSGVDYAVGSIELTSRIAKAKGIEGLRLEVMDILRDNIERPIRSTKGKGVERDGWDLITDKGVRVYSLTSSIVQYQVPLPSKDGVIVLMINFCTLFLTPSTSDL